MSADTENKKGLLISFDGLDSSGKATQTRHLVNRLRTIGWHVQYFQSPDYKTDVGKELKHWLQNTRGKWQELPWDQKMRMFADNRVEHREEVLEALGRGEIVVYDRYVPSSVAFIVVEALEPQETGLRRQQVRRSVEEYEYGHNRMPREDMSIFLDVPPKISATLLERRKEKLKAGDEYTDHLAVQQRLYNEYVELVQGDPKRFLRIRCLENGKLFGIDDVAELVWEGLITRFPLLEHQPTHA